VGFDAELWIGVFECGTMADVDDGAVGGGRILKICVGSVNTAGWKDEAGNVEIGGGEAEFLAELIAMNDFAGEGVRTAKHLAGGIKIAFLDLFANACAADRLTIKRNGGHAMYREFKFDSKLLEHSDVAASFVAEHKICADADALDFTEVVSESADELVAGLLAEFFIKVNEQEGVCAERFDRAEFLRE